MLSKVYGSGLHGVEAFLTTIEISVTKGIGYQITGLPDESVKESLSRIAIALQQNGFTMPRTKLLIHMGPANIRKSGSAFDLAIALGILLATGQLEDIGKLSQFIISGELGLDGAVKPIHGAICMSELASNKHFSGIILPQANAQEAALIKKTNVFPVAHLKDVLQFIQADYSIDPYVSSPLLTTINDTDSDFKNITGQFRLKRVMEIAAAGGHNVLMQGFPGTGKSLAAKCLSSILPSMNEQEMLETTKIYSIASRSDSIYRLIAQRPYREIHPTISEAALIGGGINAQPGEITLAHNGILFMDELNEFRPALIDALRQPLTERKIIVSRAKTIIQYPAAFMLLAAMNPCLCGYHNHPTKKCTCSKQAIYWHRRKISGPLLDRFDICVETDAPDAEDFFNPSVDNESSSSIRERVIAARKRQSIRLRHYESIHNNAQLSHDLIGQFCTLKEHEKRFLQRSWELLHLSVRSFDKILKVARTIADLAGRPEIELADIAEALSYCWKEHPQEHSNNGESLKIVHSHSSLSGWRNDYRV